VVSLRFVISDPTPIRGILQAKRQRLAARRFHSRFPEKVETTNLD
jgi:hypothetical protein